MLKSLPALLVLLALLPASLLAQSSVWKISKGDQSIYLGGTCHLLRKSDYPLPAEFDLAYAAADTLVFEIDPAAAADPSFGMQLLGAATYTDGRSLKSVLSEEAYNALAKQGAESNLPIQVLNSMKPGMAVMMVTLQELAKLGVTEEGVDIHYAKRAGKDNKPILALETPEFQINLLVNMGEGYESELVLYSLKDLNKLEQFFDELLIAWKAGKMEPLEKLFVDDMKDYPELYKDMLVDRNANWIPQIEAYLKTPETEFVLVGVGHAAG
ncbi:MAG: TraB/GumN family protein, partial [Coraliomargarita sp.]